MTPPYIWRYLDTTICLDAPMHLDTTLLPPTPPYVQTPLLSLVACKFYTWGIEFTPPYIWGYLDTPICFGCPHAFRYPLVPQHTHMFKHPLVCPQCFPVHLPYVISRPPHSPKVDAVQNQFFEDHHTPPKVETVLNQFFRTTRPSQSRNCSKSVLPRPSYLPKVETSKSVLSTTPHCPKVETVQNQFFHDHHHPPKVETVQNQFFEDHHTFPK